MSETSPGRSTHAATPADAEPRDSRLHWHLGDLAHADLSALRDCDTLVHLAFGLMGSGLTRRERRDGSYVHASVPISERVFEQATAAGIRHVIHLSSAAVFGPWPDTPVPLDETCAPRPRFAYAHAKLASEQALERALDRVAQHGSFAHGTILRPPVILGPHAHPLLNAMARTRIHFTSHGKSHPVHLLWEDDAADAIIAAIRRPGMIAGEVETLHIGATNAWSPRRMAAHGHRGTTRMHIGMPNTILRALHPLLWRLTPSAGDPGWVDGLDGPLVLDTRRAQTRLQWQPQVDVAEMLHRLRGV